MGNFCSLLETWHSDIYLKSVLIDINILEKVNLEIVILILPCRICALSLVEIFFDSKR